MKFLSHRPLATQIAVSVASVTILIVLILVSLITVRSQQAAELDVEREMRSVLSIYERELQRANAAVLERGKVAMHRFIETMGGLPEISSGVTMEVNGLSDVQSLSTLKRWNITGDPRVPKEFEKMTGADSAMFVKHAKGWVYGSTQMVDKNGKTLMGTILDAGDPLQTHLNAGKPYSGLTSVNGQWRVIAIEPLINDKGTLYGALLVSLNVSDDIEPMLESFKQDNVAQYGAVGIVAKNPQGRWQYLAGARAGQPVPDAVTKFLNGTASEQARGTITLTALHSDQDGDSLVAWTTVPSLGWVIFARGLKDDFMASIRQTSIMMALVMLVGTGLIVLVAVWFTRRLVAPVKVVVQQMERLSQGDLRLDAQLKAVEGSRNEVDLLLHALSVTQRGIAQVVGTIRESAENIRESAANIVAVNNNLSERTEIQAAGLEQTSSSMAEIASTVEQTAANSDVANQLTKDATEKAARGDAAMHDVVAAMAQISGSSGKIADIVGVIESIAFQTNILAINAAVEAARAGEHGRGFAVVANEVRTLSQRSANASKDIKALIKDSIANVESGSERVQATRVSMADLVHSVQEVNTLVADISSATKEQSVGIRQITEAVGQMDTATQQNADLVNDSAAAADKLAEQAETLTKAVRSFKL